MGERCRGTRRITRYEHWDDLRGPEFNNAPDSVAGSNITTHPCPGCPDCRASMAEQEERCPTCGCPDPAHLTHGINVGQTCRDPWHPHKLKTQLAASEARAEALAKAGDDLEAELRKTAPALIEAAQEREELRAERDAALAALSEAHKRAAEQLLATQEADSKYRTALAALRELVERWGLELPEDSKARALLDKEGE